MTGDDMTEAEKTGWLIGIAIARRYTQLLGEYGEEWGHDGIVAMATRDIWLVLESYEGDAVGALDRFLELEESLAGGRKGE